MWRMMTIISAMLGLFAWGVARDIPLPSGTKALGLAWSPDGSGIVLLYRGSEGGGVAWVEVESGEVRWQVTGFWLSPRSYPIAFAPDGDKVAVGALDRVLVISASDGEVLATVELGEHFHPLALAFLPNGALAVVVEEVRGFPGSLYLDTRGSTGELIERVPLGERNTPAPRPMADFSPDGRLLAFAAGTDAEPGGEVWLVHLLDLKTGETRTWDLRELRPELPWEGLRTQIASLALRPDGGEIAVGLYSGGSDTPLVLRLDTEFDRISEELFPSPGRSFLAETLDYSPEGSRLAFSVRSLLEPIGPVTLAVARLMPEGSQLETLCQVRFFRECPAFHPLFSPDGGTLASLGWEAVRLWDLCPEALELPAPGWTFSFSSGGAYHPKGYGEWHVRLDVKGRFDVTYQVGDTVEPYGPFQLEPEGAEELWTLIQTAGIPERESSTRPGIPDEPRYTFALEGPTCVFRVELWAGEVEEDAALTALIERISALIRVYTGEEPVI
jgi:hypothetical protein